eukprot:4156696-Pleurochrysis_carterae.AAC.1
MPPLRARLRGAPPLQSVCTRSRTSRRHCACACPPDSPRLPGIERGCRVYLHPEHCGVYLSHAELQALPPASIRTTYLDLCTCDLVAGQPADF